MPKFKRVMRYDDRQRMFRIGRLLLWKRQGHYTAKLTLAVWPKLFKFAKAWREWDLTILGVRAHYMSGGGGYV